MPDSTPPPPWFDLLRADNKDLRTDVNARFDRLESRIVPQDVFVAEQRRVDGRFKDQADDIVTLTKAIAEERVARAEAVAAERAEREKREAQAKADAERRDATMRSTKQWLVTVALAVPASAAALITVLASRGGG